jgi:predicted RNase H-like nuclease (RuvC/YqgF family)
MLLRICLIIAIVGGLAATVVNLVMVKNVITTTITERDTEKAAKETAQNDLAKTKKDLAATKTKLDSTNRQLTQTKGELDSANGKIADLEKTSADLHEQLVKTQGERDKSDQELSKWNQLNLTPAQVVQLQADLKKTTAARDGMIAENKILASKKQILEDQLNDLRGLSTIPAEPMGLTGKIVAVDPKYDFVVMNIGDDKGVVAHGILLIAREGKLIGKVQISTVANNQCVGTLLPDWTRGEVMEGDQVLD